MDGTTTILLARILAEVERRDGELVLTKDKGRWHAQVIVGATSIPAADRDVAFGHGSIFQALRHVEAELQLAPRTDIEILADRAAEAREHTAELAALTSDPDAWSPHHIDVLAASIADHPPLRLTGGETTALSA